MSLLDAYTEACVLLDEKTMSDGRGGYTSVWTEGAEFNAAFSFDDSITARQAEVQGVKGRWTILLPKGLRIDFHKAFKRLSDGQVFRCVSKDEQFTPDSATIQRRAIRAEEWELPS